jgi:hypothetical protein
MVTDFQYQFRVVFVILGGLMVVSGLIQGILDGSWYGWAYAALGVAVGVWALTAKVLWRVGPATAPHPSGRAPGDGASKVPPSGPPRRGT